MGAAIAEEQAPLEIRRSWARLIRQVYEVDPLVCPRCGGTMKIISVIERPAVIRQILDHLGLPTVTPSLRAPPDAPDGPAGALPAARTSICLTSISLLPKVFLSISPVMRTFVSGPSLRPIRGLTHSWSDTAYFLGASVRPNFTSFSTPSCTIPMPGA